MEVQFRDEIEYRAVELKDAWNVVDHSFIVQKSLTCLDLRTWEYKMKLKIIFTEEQCKKLWSPKRQILYTYHLDLPEKLEHSLRDVTPYADDDEETSEAFHLGEIFVCNSLYRQGLEECVIDHIMSAENKMEKLRRYLKVIKLLKFNESVWTALHLFDHLIQALYPECTDSNLVVDFAATFNFGTWILYNQIPTLVRYVLHHGVKIGYNIFQVSESELDLVNGCIINQSPENIYILLEYGPVLRSDPEIYLEAFRRFFSQELLRGLVRENVPDRRLCLMLQLLYYFLFNIFSKGLLYIWRSIPDPCLSKSELRFLFKNVISSSRLCNMIEYYKLHIVEERDEIDDKVPRPLQHLCRVAVRSALNRNNQLPYGIGMLGSPRLIRSYLNLEC